MVSNNKDNNNKDNNNKDSILFEDMLEMYLEESEETLEKLNKRMNNKCGKPKRRCNKGKYELDTNRESNKE